MRPEQYCRHVADVIFKCMFSNQNLDLNFTEFIRRAQLTISRHWLRQWLMRNGRWRNLFSHYRHFVRKTIGHGAVVISDIPTKLFLTINMRNYFIDYRRYIHILNRILDLAGHKSMEQQYMLSVLRSQHHACWCSATFVARISTGMVLTPKAELYRLRRKKSWNQFSRNLALPYHSFQLSNRFAL